MTKPVVAFLPCRTGSVRVPNKNTRPFAGHVRGLLEIKLAQLERVRALDAVVLDSDDPTVLEYGCERRRCWNGPPLQVRERPDALGSSATTTDELIAYVYRSLDFGTLLWTHVTSPLFDETWYRRALQAFVERGEGHDSLMGVTSMLTFLWSDTRPLNYEREDSRWPFTQSLTPVYEVNSAVFLVERAVGEPLLDRIGATPLMFLIPPSVAVDVDWPDDFAVAEALYHARTPSLDE